MFNVWKNVLAEVERSIEPAAFATWFTGISLISIDDNIVTVGVPNVFKKKQIETKYDNHIKTALKHNQVDFNTVEYVVQNNAKAKRGNAREVSITDTLKNQPLRKKPEKKSIQHFNTGISPKYTLDNFVIGSNNDLAVSVAKTVIDRPGEQYNPFFLYGGPGLGKTHLVQAIGNALLKKDPNLKIFYTPINHFYSDFIKSIQEKSTDAFYEKFRKLDVLIVDDFQQIVGKDRSQEQFFNIFNDLYQLNKQIIVTSDRLPSQIKTVDERLASRLTWAGAIDLQMPSFEDKCAILQSMADFNGIQIESEAIEYLAENVHTNIRDLEGQFKTLVAISELKNITPLEVIQGGFTSSFSNNRVKAVSPKQVIDHVAKFYQLTSKEICSRSRVSNIKNARQIAMYILQEDLSMSTPKIALEVGLKDHSTVIHGVRKIKEDLKINFTLRDEITAIRGKIYGK